MKFASEKPVAIFAPSPALAAELGSGVSVAVYAVAGGGFAFEVLGEAENAGAFVSGDGSPFASVEAARDAANDPASENVAEFDYGD